MERANARMAVMYSNIGILTVSRNLYIAGGWSRLTDCLLASGTVLRFGNWSRKSYAILRIKYPLAVVT